MASEAEIQTKWMALSPVMDERMRRLWAGVEAEAHGDGGLAAVERATGMSRTTIRAGRDEVHAGASREDVVHTRRPGGGRPRLEQNNPRLIEDLEALVEPVTRGDPESPLRWTSKSTRKLSEELAVQGHQVSPQKVGQLLHAQGYSLQGTQKTIEGADHPDRNGQFEYINDRVDDALGRGTPAISVDTKKKELVGDFKNAGREWRPEGKPVPVRVHDFPDDAVGKAIPYGVYDIGRNLGWVNVGTDHDTPEFAVESIRRWWRSMGRRIYEDAQELLITADAGGSNGYRLRLWKTELQRFADEARLRITVCHFPPGTSKWNKIEHRMFSHITLNWRGHPLVDYETVVNLIGSTRTTAGLRVKATLDTNTYPTGIEVTKEDIDELHILHHAYHGDWNYTFIPR
ncbi:MAG: ISAzo13 family transposase [Armatimonadota bacterium]